MILDKETKIENFCKKHFHPGDKIVNISLKTLQELKKVLPPNNF